MIMCRSVELQLMWNKHISENRISVIVLKRRRCKRCYEYINGVYLYPIETSYIVLLFFYWKLLSHFIFLIIGNLTLPFYDVSLKRIYVNYRELLFRYHWCISITTPYWLVGEFGSAGAIFNQSHIFSPESQPPAYG